VIIRAEARSVRNRLIKRTQKTYPQAEWKRKFGIDSSMSSITAQRLAHAIFAGRTQHTEEPEVYLRIAIDDIFGNANRNKEQRGENVGKTKCYCCLEAIQDLQG